MTVALVAAYAVLAVLLTWAVVGARGHWGLKAAMIVVAPALAFALWQGHLAPKGWPASSKPDGAFLWGVVREPNPQTGDKGAIFIWDVPAGSVKPRAYQLPYTRQLHKQVQGANRQAKHGGHLAVQFRKGRPGQKERLRFYREPPLRLPSKQASP